MLTMKVYINKPKHHKLSEFRRTRQQQKVTVWQEMKLLLLALFSLLPSVLCLDEPLVVHIDGDRGKDSVRCFNSSYGEKCRSLSYVAQRLPQRVSSVEIEIDSRELNLTGGVNFTKFSSLSISGNSATIVCNESGAGLAFVDVHDLTLSALTIEGCGAERESTSVDPLTQNTTDCLRVAVYVLNCTDVFIHRVDVRSSNGTGLSLYDTNGKVEIVGCNFTGNVLKHGNVEPGGGGVRVEFTICPPGTVGDCSGEILNSHYIIQNSTFSGNDIFCPSNRQQYISPFSHKATPRLGRGGGLYVSIGSNAAGNLFSIEGCVFENNSASFGGSGMLVEFINSVQNNRVSVVETNFTENHCSSLCSGGGLVLDAMFYDHSDPSRELPKDNSFSCTDCLFTRNTANIGGGAGIYMTKNRNSPRNLTSITFSRCTWRANVAPLGAAVFISPGVWDYVREGFLPSPLFANCAFESNSPGQGNRSSSDNIRVLSVGFGAVFLSEVKVKFEGRTVFTRNNGSAVHLSNSVLDFGENSNVTFHENVAHSGGAIAMFASSMLQIQNDSTFTFTNNSAYSKGGAIYVDFKAGMEPVYHNCFIASSNYTRMNSTRLIFDGNKANVSGSSIFTTTFQPCQLLCPVINMSQLNFPEKILDCVANFDISNLNDNCSHTQKIPILATRPKYFELGGNTPVHIIPGTEYQLKLSVKDEAHAPLSQVVYEASTNSNVVELDQPFTQVSNNTVRLLGPSQHTAELSLSISDTVVVFNVTLTDCQPGYSYVGKDRRCKCRASDYLGLMGCDPTVYIKQGYWMGPCLKRDPTKLCTAFCPDGFCSYHGIHPGSGHHPLPDKSSMLDPELCGPTRTGRLCGKCAPNHSIYFNSFSYTCGPERLCGLGWFFYIASEILPLTLLFLIILFFNISFTTGNVNCFVLYAQILHCISFSGNGNIQLPYRLKQVQKVVTFIYNPFSLDFFTTERLSFCLWKGANFADVMMMKYGTVTVALVLVLLTILFARHGYLRRKLFVKFRASDSVLIHGLTAFFVLCYAQSVRVTAHLLNLNCLYSEGFGCSRYAVKRMGHMTYFEGEHVKYAIIAVFVLTFMVIIPPLLLIVYPLVFRLLGHCRLSESKLANVLWRCMPIQFLDAFQSSFKDRYRLFAGLYFFYRTVIIGVHVFCQSWLQFYAIVQLQLLIALTVQALFQPHKEKKHNLIDTLLFANLSAINIITFYYYATKDFSQIHSSQVIIRVLAVVQAVLILLPLLCVVATTLNWRRILKKAENLRDLPSLRSSEHDSLLKKW